MFKETSPAYRSLGLLLASGTICIYAITSCTPGGSGGGGSSISAADCANLDADVAVSVGGEGPRTASAVTSACEELAVFSDPTSKSVTGVAVSLPTEGGSEEAQVVIGEDGAPVAIRTADGDATLSLNDATGAVRINVSGQNPSSGTFVVDRQDLMEARRRVQQNGEVTSQAELCAELAVTDAVLKAVIEPCEGSEAPAYCGSSIETSAQAVSRLCSAEDVLEIDEIRGLQLPDAPEGLNPQLTGLGVDGFVITRAAANGGTTFILTSIVYGGSAPYGVDWEQISGQTVSLQALPGNAAVGDSFSREGRYAFRVLATDDSGQSASDDVEVDLDVELDVTISVTNPTPDIGEEVIFSATGTAISEPATYFWTFGDGTSGTGPQVAHVYETEEIFPVSLNVTVLGRDLADSVDIVVGDAFLANGTGVSGAGGTRSSGDFFLDILLGPTDFLEVGDQRQLGVGFAGAIEPVEFGWFILEGPGSIFDPATPSDEGFAFSVTPTLSASAEGIIVVGVVAIDAHGRFAEATRAVPVFGPEGGLYATILGPFVAEPDESVQLDSFVVGASEATLSFNWFIEADDFSLADDFAVLESTRDSSTVVTGSVAGVILVGLDVTDQATGDSFTAFFLLEILCLEEDGCIEDVLCPFDYYCDPFCPGFDPDCEAEVDCEFADGFCDVTCFFMLRDDPDCTNDDICFETGGIELEGFCCSGDDFCDEGCPTLDPQCSSGGGNDETCFETGFCCSGDGFCDVDCPAPDPDCGSSGGGNDEVCFETGFCCNGDGFCDVDCPEIDSDCF